MKRGWIVTGQQLCSTWFIFLVPVNHRLAVCFYLSIWSDLYSRYKVWLCPSGCPTRSCRLRVEGEHSVSYQDASVCRNVPPSVNWPHGQEVQPQEAHWPCSPSSRAASDCSSPAAALGKMILISPKSSIISSFPRFISESAISAPDYKRGSWAMETLPEGLALGDRDSFLFVVIRGPSVVMPDFPGGPRVQPSPPK